MTRHPLASAPAIDDPTVTMLRVIGDPDATAEQLDSEALARRLGWTAAETAAALDAAKRGLLVWGIRVGGTPAPCFEEIELTVQGRRLLLAAELRSKSPMM